MKIRKHFVSNSFATSFVIDGTAYENVFELAKAIVIHRWNMSEQFYEGEYNDRYLPINKRVIEEIDKVKEKGTHPNTGIYVHSTNHDIIVIREGKNYYAVVNTGDDYVSGLRGVLECEGGVDPNDDRLRGHNFYFPEYGVFGTLLIDLEGSMTFCPEHYLPLLNTDEGALCPDCLLIENRRME